MKDFVGRRGGRAEDLPITTDHLRYEIDSGEAGDKVSHSDPATAPLGTDEEAGGTHPVVMAEDRRRISSGRRDTETAHKRSIWGWPPLLLIGGFAFLSAAGAILAIASVP